MINNGSFIKHTMGETLEAGWLVRIKHPGKFTTSELGCGDGPYTGVVLDQVDSKEWGGDRLGDCEFWRILLPNGKKPIVMPDEVDLIAG